MKQVIYYPSFESTNENFLKFSLLYLDELRPIIPPSGDSDLSDLYKKNFNESDLLIFQRPDYEEGYNSSLDAIDIVEKIMSDPYRYDIKFDELNVIETWQQSENQTYKIYQEKYSHDWKNFCIDNKFAQKTDGGLLISEQLGALYMTVLANTIGDINNLPPFTEIKKYHKLSYFVKSNAPKKLSHELVNAQSIIKLKLPVDLETISVDTIINLRNTNSYKKHLRAFHKELDDFYWNIENNNNAFDFINKLETANNDLLEILSKHTTKFIEISVGSWLLLNNPDAQTLEYLIKAAAGIGLLIDGKISIKNTWRNSSTKRNARRFLSDLSNIKIK